MVERKCIRQGGKTGGHGEKGKGFWLKRLFFFFLIRKRRNRFLNTVEIIIFALDLQEAISCQNSLYLINILEDCSLEFPKRDSLQFFFFFFEGF